MNEEFPVSASHKLALITSLPFVHTARRYYRLSGSVRASDWSRSGVQAPAPLAEKTLELDRLEKVKVVTSTTLSGGSLGSCVDEERSQLRELM
ncbi:hypothetical protein Btru_066325 [Bulinus truncatus]|nr:hypothetical protein Btru_066325 [Bulinus truncatus]